MKKIIYYITIFFLISINPINAQSSEEQILDYQIQIDVLEDSTLNIKEKITYDFTQKAKDKHGIYRIIPYYYGSQMLNYDIVYINEQYEESIGNNNIVLKIGNPNKNVSGIKEYIIEYNMIPGIVFDKYENMDFFHWNVIGHYWDIPIKNAEIVINFPKEIHSIDHMKCFSGRFTSTERNCSIVQKENKKSFKIRNTVILHAYSGMTVEIALPKDIVQKPGEIVIVNQLLWGKVETENRVFENLPQTIYVRGGKHNLNFSRFGYKSENVQINISHGETKFLEFETDEKLWFVFFKNLPFLLIPVSILLTFLIWITKGKDKGRYKTIVVEFDPPKDIAPLEMGVLNSIDIKNKYISATIIRFAVLGFLKIIYEEEKILFWTRPKYFFQKLKDPNTPLVEYERKLFKEFFKHGDKDGLLDLKKLEYKFEIPVLNLKKSVWDTVLKKDFFTRDPRISKNTYIFLSIFSFIAIAMVGGLIFLDAFLTSAMIFFGITVSTCTFLLSKTISQRTENGSELYRHIKGLKTYLNIAEKERIKFHNAPEKTPEVFEKLLPYAIILGVEKKWAESFKNIYSSPPDWYTGSNIGTFNAVFFTNSLTRATSSVTTSMTSSSSGSTGSSGGGGGGGGGGSW